MHAFSISRLSGLQNPKPNAIANCVTAICQVMLFDFRLADISHIRSAYGTCSMCVKLKMFQKLWNIAINSVFNEFIYLILCRLLAFSILSTIHSSLFPTISLFLWRIFGNDTKAVPLITTNDDKIPLVLLSYLIKLGCHCHWILENKDLAHFLFESHWK